MNDTFFDTVDNLCNIFCAKPINWKAFDYALAEIEDINVYNEEHETTLLSEFLTEVEFSHDGMAQIEVIRHFLDNGYDVGKNDGRTAGAVLDIPRQVYPRCREAASRCGRICCLQSFV